MAKGNFNACFNFTIGQEGSYQSDKDDSGNWSSGEVGVGRLIGTCWGISAPVLIAWEGSKGSSVVTAAYMRELPQTTAKAIYASKFWNAVCGDSLPIGVDLAVWDFGVNAGVSATAKLLQRLVGTDQDGWIGPETLAAVDTKSGPVLIESLIEAHDAYYGGLSPTAFAEYGKGWLARQQRLKTAALAMAAPTAVSI